MVVAYLEEDLRNYIPNIFGLLYNMPDWNDIVRKLNSPNKVVSSSFLDSNLYEIILHAKKGDINALSLLEFFNIIFREICTLPVNCKMQLNDKAIEFLRVLNSDFKNYLGEFAVLDTIIKTNEFKLVNVEASLENGKTSEYLFEKHNSSEKYYVEVLNINLNETHTNLKRTLRRKIVSKVNKKTKNSKHEIIVVPVIWGNIGTLQRLQKAYNEHFEVKYAYEPFAYYGFTDGKSGIIEHRFHRITNFTVNS
jgi:hypothetical protein